MLCNVSLALHLRIEMQDWLKVDWELCLIQQLPVATMSRKYLNLRKKTKLVTVAADATVQYIYTYTVFGFWAKHAGSSQKPDIYDTGDSDFFLIRTELPVTRWYKLSSFVWTSDKICSFQESFLLLNRLSSSLLLDKSIKWKISQFSLTLRCSEQRWTQLFALSNYQPSSKRFSDFCETSVRKAQRQLKELNFLLPNV